MLKLVLLLFAVAGFNAKPLNYNTPRIQNGGWVIGAPQLVQNGQEYMGDSGPAEDYREDTKSEPQWEVVLAPVDKVNVRDDMDQKVAHVEDRRQGTEPTRRLLVDLNTGLLKEYISEMDRRVYNPASNPEFRQGTQNSRATLVNTRTGQQLPQLSEMQRRAAPLSQFRQGTEYSEPTLKELRKVQTMKSMEKTQVSKEEITHKAVLPEFRRQETEPSRRFLADPDTGIVKEHVSEMERRVSVYNPVSNPEFRQGTQNSRATLVNTRTGQQLPQLSEMQRRAAPLSQFRQGTEYSEPTLKELRKTETMKSVLADPDTGIVQEHDSEMERRVSGFYNPASNPEFRQGTQNSRATLVNTRTGQQLPQLSEMQRRAAPLSQFRQGTEYSEPTLKELRKVQTMKSMEKTQVSKEEITHKAVLPEFRRQETEPSRRFLADPDTGIVKEHVSEMERRVSVYNPASNPEFRQGTQNSRATLVNTRTGQQLPQLSEMQRRAAPLSQFRQGTEYSEPTLKELRKTETMKSVLADPDTGIVQEHDSEMERRVSGFYNPASNPEFRQGTQNSRATLVNTRTGQQLPQLSEMQRRASPLSQFRQGTEYSEPTLKELRKVQTMKSMEKTQVSKEEITHKAVLPEFRRQETEPSRRFLADPNTGIVKEHVSEMERRVSVYNPASNPEFRQGTQNSRATLVNTRTGQQLPQLSEMQRRAAPLSQFRQGTEYSEPTLKELRKVQTMKSMEKTQVSKEEITHKAVLPEFRRQETEPSRRFLVDPNTGIVKEHVSEMERRVSGLYNPASNPEFRQGTQNSRVTLVNTRTGQQLPQLSEMQRRASPYEFRQGTEYSLVTLVNLRNAQMTVGKDQTPHTVQDTETNEVFPEFKRGIEYSQTHRQRIMDHQSFQGLESNEVDVSSPMDEFRRGMEYSHANIIDRRIMEPSYVK